MKKCIYCDVIIPKGSQHQRWCSHQPGGKPIGNRRGIPSWNANKFGDPRLLHSEESKKLMSEKRKSRKSGWDKDNAAKISATVRQKVEDGTWHTSLAKRLHFRYKGFDLHGSWELAYAKFLDSVGTPWSKNTRSFSYEFEGKKRRYTPDFYLPLEDVYVEIKGYKTEKDVAKWSQFPETLIVLMNEDLKSMMLI